MGYDAKKDLEDLHMFINVLPHKLKIETCLYIYEERYSKLKYFRDQSVSFITWMCPLLKPSYYGDKEFIFSEGDDIKEIHFLIDGAAAFVLPSFRNTKYIKIEKGDHFGIIDFIGSS